MKDKLIYNISGKEYLLVEHMITRSTDVDELNKTIKKFKAIEQGYGEIVNGGFVRNGHAIVKILVPSTQILKWQDAFGGLSE